MIITIDVRVVLLDIQVRKMKKKDIPHVQYVAKTSWHATYDGIIPRNIQDDFLQEAYSKDAMKHRLKNSHFFVAESSGRIIGFANYSLGDKDGKVELGAIYLLPEYQGKGAGTALLREGIEKLQSVREIHLNVEKNNNVGKKFYEAKGFEVVSEFDEDFAGHMLKTVRMALTVE
ncbi:N-acetyltransferase family protein [Virgibacillus oceani]